MKKLLISLLGLSWVLAAQSQETELRDKEIEKPYIPPYYVNFFQPYGISFDGSEQHYDLFLATRLNAAERMMKGMQLRARDGRLHTEVLEWRAREDRYLSREARWKALRSRKQGEDFNRRALRRGIGQGAPEGQAREIPAQIDRIAEKNRRTRDESVRLARRYWERVEREDTELKEELQESGFVFYPQERN